MLEELESWTFVILEDLKEKAKTMQLGRLRWVLSTAMPLSAKFKLFLNGDEVKSSKEAYDTLVKFAIGDLPDARIKALRKKTGLEWSSNEGVLAPMSQKFPSEVVMR